MAWRRGALVRACVGLSILASALGGCGADVPTEDEGPKDMGFKDGEGGDGDTLGEGDCSMAGLWAVRQTAHVQALVTTTTANWYFIELAQDGDDIEVVDHFDCGYGSASTGGVGLTSAATDRGMALHNLQKGRHGTSKRSGAFCDFKLDRFWAVRGADEAAFLPAERDDPRTLAEIQAEMPLPTVDALDGQQDWDGDGNPGITFQIGSLGARYSASREWDEYFSCNGTAADSPVCQPEDVEKYALLAASAKDTVVLRMDYDSEDSVLGATSDLYAIKGMTLRIADNRITWKRLGASRDDTLAKQMFAIDDMHERCEFIRRQLPQEQDDE
jgi:hypothetical protein